MLIKFSVQNYLSFKDLTTLEMLPATITQHQENILCLANYKLLKSVAIFGANSSGKSNLFKAMKFSRNFILNSSKETQANENIPVVPFLLSTETDNEPSLFEFIFVKENIKYRYGFIVNNTEIIDEWLFSATKVKESLLFERHLQVIKIGQKFKEGEQLKKLTRNNALFLSVVAQFNGEIANSILDWFNNLNIITGLNDYIGVTLGYIDNLPNKDEFMELFKVADSSIMDLKLQEIDNAKIPKIIQDRLAKARESGIELKMMPEIKALHCKYDNNHKIIDNVEFDFNKVESKGTQNLFSLLGPIMDTIQNGKVLVIDELESNLHPLITQLLIKMFHLKNNNAQFIFNTHDINLLNNKFFRRDQIYFIDRNKYGQSNLYSLYDYNNNVRHDKTFNTDYLKGRYGAIPFIDEYGLIEENTSFQFQRGKNGN